MENPWSIHSIYELQYFICPSCSFKDHSKQEFINHAYEFHPDFVNYLKIHDNSLSDIECPWNKPTIKINRETTNINDTLEATTANITSKCITDPLKIDVEDNFVALNMECEAQNEMVQGGGLQGQSTQTVLL